MILIIDTSSDVATASLSHNGKILAEKQNNKTADHASFLQLAIKLLFNENSLTLQNLDAIAVNAGPGSYTGLRVGMASAKGICYAINKPLITINSLYAMAFTVAAEIKKNIDSDKKFLVCPMIDARRMEVYTALYDNDLHEILEPTAMILSNTSFSEHINSHKIFFTGNGATKFTTMLQHQNVRHFTLPPINSALARLAEDMFRLKSFASLAYSEPIYLKGIYIPGR